MIAMMKMQTFFFVLSLLCGNIRSDKVIHTTFQGHNFGTVLISTMDGKLRAVDTLTGKEKWILSEEPVLRSPSSVKQGFTFLPNPQDGSLYALKEGTLKKLPFNIPQLVHASPCRGNDGILYAGNKKDYWFGLDPETGKKIETLSSATMNRVCPASQKHTIFIGRSEYHVNMFDAKNHNRSWNATFTDYSAHLLPADAAYPYQHFSSSSTGHVLTVNAAGEVVWDKDFGEPIVAMYLLQNDGLHKLRYTVMGRETMENLIAHAFEHNQWDEDILHGGSHTPSRPTLYPILYVGETTFGLYAISSFVDEKTITYAPKYLGPPLIEGGSAIALTEGERSKIKPLNRPIVQIDYPSITTTTPDGEFLLLGYHEPPQLDLGSIIPTKFPIIPTVPHIEYKPERHVEERRKIASDKNQSEDESLVMLISQIYRKHPTPFYVSLITLVVLIISIVWMCGKQSGAAAFQQNEARSVQTSRHSNSGKGWLYTKGDDIPDGWMSVGKLHYDPVQVLGRGCEGTVVYKGKFDGREVAVKRVVSEFVRLVDREVDLLRESDTHSHVVRYFCMESDSQFRYIALELCMASLNDYVEQPSLRKEIHLTPMEILVQATDGLAHLHLMNIVHRDVKPQNVLLSMANMRGQVRALISDFGLCKRIRPGKNSLSQRSGMAGTDGWIAPEALFDQSTSYPVDVFSLGCIFYFVLSNGKHPFGDSLQRQMNIVNEKFNLSHLREEKGNNEATCLIEAMLRREPAERPTASTVLMHPFFWSPDRKLQFFGDVSDRVEKEEVSSPVVDRLESNAKAVLSGNWRNQICDALAEDLRKFRTYKGFSVRDLLRAMRNKKHHYRELPEKVRDSLGHIPEQFVQYFTSRFPLLLLHSYEALKWCSHEPVFRGYYSDETRMEMREIVQEEEARRKEDAEERDGNGVWQRGIKKTSQKKVHEKGSNI